MDGGVFDGCSFVGANLTGCSLRNASLRHCCFARAQCGGIDVGALPSVCPFGGVRSTVVGVVGGVVGGGGVSSRGERGGGEEGRRGGMVIERVQFSSDGEALALLAADGLSVKVCDLIMTIFLFCMIAVSLGLMGFSVCLFESWSIVLYEKIGLPLDLFSFPEFSSLHSLDILRHTTVT